MRLVPLACALILVGVSSAAHADAIDDLKPGSWYEAPNSKLRSVCPPDEPGYEWSFYCKGVMSAWSGAALDGSRGRLLVWGGGHADYKGNEVYAFDLGTLAWSRLWGPTPHAQIPAGGTHEQYDDGSPGSRHTYSGLAYVPAPTDALLSFGGSLWQSGNYGQGVWSFGFAAGKWTRKADGPGEQGYGDPTVYDPKTGHVFRRGNARMHEYDPVADTHTPRAESNGGFWAANVSAALDPEARLMVIVGEGRVDLYHLDTDKYEQGVTLSGATAKDLFGGSAPGIDFDTALKKFVLWGGGATVYTFDPSQLAFEQHATTGATPGKITASGGVFGRFRHVPTRNVFVAVNDVDESVFVLRMAPGTGTPPPIPDAGAGGAGGAGGAPAGGATGSTGDDDSGCGCAVPRRGGGSAWSLLALALVLGRAARARRRMRACAARWR